jgi:RNA-directed DNA polymerase
LANNDATSKLALAERREGRRAAKGNAGQAPAPRTQSRIRASMGLDDVREAARKSKEVRFTTLMHHITSQLLSESFMHLKRTAAAGIDGLTWRQYEEGWLRGLKHYGRRWQAGRYRALPSRRVYTPRRRGNNVR